VEVVSIELFVGSIKMISEVSLHPANKRGSPSKPQIIPSTNHETILKEQWQQSADKHRSEIAELSPDERYVRFHDVITKTNNVQISYKAFDTINGVEIAWHKISMSSFQQSDYDKFVSCINIVNSLHCENIVEYQATWFSNYLNKRINQSDVVTESGGVAYGDGYEFLNIITTHLESLSEFIGKVKTLKWKIIKKWCRHVLQGLQVLHYQEKPIVHGNLSCSHIYIDGTSGKITIGDIWLSTVLGISHPIESAFRAKELTGNNAPVDSKVSYVCQFSS
jgi:WNK lysine deficient protein kinase